MGLDYSFILVAERSKADALVNAVAQRLTSEDRERLLTCLPYDASVGLKHVSRKPFEQLLFEKSAIDDLCLAFLFPVDSDIAQYAKEFSRAAVDGKMPVGCVWCSIRCENRFIAIHAMAATSAMSRLFEDSLNAQTTFAEIARDSGARLALFDDEQPAPRVLWPNYGRLELQNASDPHCNDDSYYAAVLTDAERLPRSTLI